VGEENRDLAEKDCVSSVLKPLMNRRADRHWVETACRTRAKTHKKKQEEESSLEPQKLDARAESSANEFPGSN
jgi:hypothetical protein